MNKVIEMYQEVFNLKKINIEKFSDLLVDGKKFNQILLSNTKNEGKHEGEEKFNKILSDQELPIYIKYENPSLNQTHRQIIYKRLNPIGNVNMWDLFTNNWFDISKGINNKFNVDFKLFSNMEDAMHDRNQWKFCNFNDPGIGFPRDCGPNGGVGGQWLSFKRVPGRGYGFANWSFTLVVPIVEEEVSIGDKKFTKKLILNTHKYGAVSGAKKFNEELKKQTLPIFILYENKKSELNKIVVYKRYTPIEDIDMFDLFTNNWFNSEKKVRNNINSDFDLFNSMEDAIANKNRWSFCNFNDPGVGFPRDCGKKGPVGGQWISLIRIPSRGYGFQDWSFSLMIPEKPVIKSVVKKEVLEKENNEELDVESESDLNIDIEVPEEETEKNSNTLIYIISGISLVVLIIVLIIILTRSE